MVEIVDIGDPTLRAIDAALEAKQFGRRDYLGMSQIGEECERRLWYSHHSDLPNFFDAASMRRVQDGFKGEDVMAERLRMVEGIELHTVDPATGEQFAYKDFNGKFSGHMDGAIKGLLQAPKTWHVWEHKQVNEKKFAEMNKIKITMGEKDALRHWDATYYAQAILYMFYSGMDRHYLTVCTPGGRDYTSCRTEANNRLANALRLKAQRIIEATTPLTKINESPAFYKCKMCPYKDECHKK